MAEKPTPMGTCLISTLLVLMFGVAIPAKAQGDCQSVYDADDKLLATDHRAFSAHSPAIRGGHPETTESVMVGGVTYVKVKGAWRKSPLAVTELREQKAENRKSAKNVSCRYLRDEFVDGEAARVFSAHSETEDGKYDLTVWISKNRGLPVRQEEDIDTGDKVHYSIHYEYTNVALPSAH